MRSDQSEPQRTNADSPAERESPAGEHNPQPMDVADESNETEELGSELASDSQDTEIQRELDAMKERYLRLAAEYDNFRKRTDRERVDSRDRSQGQLVEQLLEPLDDLQRVAEFNADNTTVEALLEGIRMVERKFVKALEAAGLEPLDARGQRFDPELHDALFTSPTDTPEEDDTVGDVLQPGYRFRGLLLRPARVQVRKHGD